MKNKVIKYYLYILPIYSLIGIVLSVFRTAYQENFALIFLLTGAILDALIIFFGRKQLFNKTILFLILLLLISFIVGGLNGNELSRRYITDITNPLFFFGKIFIFKQYWNQVDFGKFIKYYIRISFWGSLLLLPLVYFLFRQAGASRLAIFPPMELPFSFYMQGFGVWLLVSLLIIILYGKRAQLVGAIVTFMVYVFLFRKKQFLKYTFIILFLVVGTSFLFNNFSENLAIRRLSYTFESFQDQGGGLSGAEAVSAGRFEEIEAVIKEMNGVDYFFGKGLGYVYEKDVKDGLKEIGNVHFSPLSFLLKYGFIFTIFIYIFILTNLFNKGSSVTDSNYIAAFGTSLFVFIESFFAYALFVTQILPIVFGYILYRNKKRNSKYVN